MPKKSNQRPYEVVSSKEPNVRRCVVASNKAQAIRHVVGKEYSARAMRNMELLRLLDDGTKPEYANESEED